MYEVFGCFKQLPVNFTLVSVPWYFNTGVRLLSDDVGGLIVSADNTLHLYDET